MLQRSPHSRPFCTHIDKVKPYTADKLPKSWLVAKTSDGSADVPETAQGQAVHAEKHSAVHNGPAQPAGAQTESAECMAEVDTPLAGVQPVNFRTPRPRRSMRRPQRYCN